MALANEIVLFGGLLILVSILAGVVSSRIGAPLLLVFLALGMLAGENGPGGIRFDDFQGAYLIGSVALAIILFDGGLRTPLESIRLAWAPASVLATLGVVITGAVTAAFAIRILGHKPLEGMLLGAIVSSTDAAAVFLLLHQRGMDLKRRVSATLEIESGVNDPMAVMLTLTLVELIKTGGDGGLGPSIARNLLTGLGAGVAVGLAGGAALAWLVNRLELAPGLYPVFVAAGALTLFGGAQELGGSGFLAVYLAGLVAGNQRLRANKLIHRFHDGIAWMSQIVMFVMLGLLVTPAKLVGDLPAGALIAVVLILVARPLATFLTLLPFRFEFEERLFIAWVGLRGAVPIFLAIIPVLGGIPGAIRYFNVAFIVVLASLLFQGWMVPWVARRLEVEVPPAPESAGRLDIDLPSQMDRELVGYRIGERSPAAFRAVGELALPRRARLLVVLRDNVVVPHGAQDELRSGDYVLCICPPERTILLDRLFVPRAEPRWRRPEVVLDDFVFAGSTPLGSIASEYDLPITSEERTMTLEAFARARLGRTVTVGDRVRLGEIELVVHDVVGKEIRQIGLRLEPHAPKRWYARLPGGAWLAALLRHRDPSAGPA